METTLQETLGDAEGSERKRGAEDEAVKILDLEHYDAIGESKCFGLTSALLRSD